MKINGILFLILLFVISNFVQAGVYKHVDKDGNITYSNVHSNDAKAVDLPSLTVVPAIQTEAFNSIIERRKESTSIKRQRNDIENQIADEESRLSDLKNEYKDGTPDRIGSERNNYQRYLDRVERLKGEIAVREINLSNLQRNLQDLPSPTN